MGHDSNTGLIRLSWIPQPLGLVLLLPRRHKFNSRYATFGFNDEANLDEGAVWPTSFP
jgi:hypothetical protein